MGAMHAAALVLNALSQCSSAEMVEYFIAEEGQDACPVGAMRIIDTAECQVVADALAMPFAGSGCFYMQTMGCFDNTGVLFHNTCTAATTASDHAPVCGNYWTLTSTTSTTSWTSTETSTTNTSTSTTTTNETSTSTTLAPLAPTGNTSTSTTTMTTTTNSTTTTASSTTTTNSSTTTTTASITTATSTTTSSTTSTNSSTTTSSTSSSTTTTNSTTSTSVSSTSTTTDTSTSTTTEPTCACIGKLPDTVPEVPCSNALAISGTCIQASTPNGVISFPSNYGDECGLHDLQVDPSCWDVDQGRAVEVRPTWCELSWCFVVNCTLYSNLSVDMRFGVPALVYSYEQCADWTSTTTTTSSTTSITNTTTSTTSITTTNTTTMTTRTVTTTTTPSLAESCTCIGKGELVSKVPSIACNETFAIDDTCLVARSLGAPHGLHKAGPGVLYPSNYGEECGPHVEVGNPECFDMNTSSPTRSTAPECNRRWCYVVNCSGADVTLDMHFPNANLSYSDKFCVGWTSTKTSTTNTSSTTSRSSTTLTKSSTTTITSSSSSTRTTTSTTGSRTTSTTTATTTTTTTSTTIPVIVGAVNGLVRLTVLNPVGFVENETMAMREAIGALVSLGRDYVRVIMTTARRLSASRHLQAELVRGTVRADYVVDIPAHKQVSATDISRAIKDVLLIRLGDLIAGALGSLSEQYEVIVTMLPIPSLGPASGDEALLEDGNWAPRACVPTGAILLSLCAQLFH